MSLAKFLDEKTLGKYPTEEFMQDYDIVVNSTGTGTMGRIGLLRDSDNPGGLPTTAKQRMGALASFADYAQSRNLDAAIVFRTSLEKIAKKSFRRTKGKQRRSFTREELKVLFSLPDTSTKMGFRDLVLLVVMYSSGARAQEICDLRLKDIAHDEKGNIILTLTGKGEKTRRVKITAETSQMLDKYIAYRKIAKVPEGQGGPYGIHQGEAECGCDLEQAGGRKNRSGSDKIIVSIASPHAQLIAGSTGDVKRDWGASPTSMRRHLSGHRHCSHSIIRNSR